ncbi:MAG: DUF1844 domain-containing protein [Thermodesulfobacteriota bacterium]|nr:DUF1844 domain-containing protein [Thermodesulfobacteriota bacterium]
MEPDEEKKVKVQDKRRIKDSDKDIEENKKTEETPIKETPPKTEGKPPQQSPPPLPEIDFVTFIISLSSSVSIHFGDMPDPVTNVSRVNLPLAKQTIDIISMLKEKTKGNLNASESKLIDTLLFELRMRYVKAKDSSHQK